MSFTAIKWAQQIKVGNATGKTILIAIAYHADDKGVCVKSPKCLADESECSLATVSRWLKKFEDRGLMRRSNGRTSLLIGNSSQSHLSGCDARKGGVK